MLVPSAYLNKSSPGLRDRPNEKEGPLNSTRYHQKHIVSQSQATSPQVMAPTVPVTPPTSVSSPVRIPQGSQKARPHHSYSQPGAREIAQRKKIHSVAAAPLESLLASTVIPPRRTRGRKSQKLPKGDHVADFSKLLLEDVVATEDRTALGSFGNPQFEDLFGHSADKETAWRGAPEPHQPITPLSVRSMSTESMPSLVVDDDIVERSLGDFSTPATSVQRGSPERRVRLLSTSQHCGDDHPLRHPDVLAPLTSMYDDAEGLPVPSRSPPAQKSRTSVLRSNLTASLRALKSVAHTVSSLANLPPTTISDDFLTRSIFSFAPELTDDKRPPPSDHPPSPALRRYLNPHHAEPDARSPAELHSYSEYHDRLKPAKKKKSRPPSPPSSPKSIQLQTCIPSPIRSPHASSPPIWLSPDGTPTAPTDLLSFAGPNLARQREPRENPAFLRILVAEMNMRRSGKFDDAMASHACVWLPARKSVDGQAARTGTERWMVYRAEGAIL